jgi:hypothetical protein
LGGVFRGRERDIYRPNDDTKASYHGDQAPLAPKKIANVDKGYAAKMVRIVRDRLLKMMWNKLSSDIHDELLTFRRFSRRPA